MDDQLKNELLSDLEDELLAALNTEAQKQPARIETGQEAELLVALQLEAERRVADYQVELEALEADTLPILAALEAVQVDTSPLGAGTEDAAPAVPPRPVSAMIWDEHYAEILLPKNRKFLRSQDMARLGEIAARGTPIHGDDVYLRDLLRYLRDELPQPPGLIGQAIEGQRWGMQSV